MTSTLASWNDGAARQAVVEFVERTASEDVPVEERVATFDNEYRSDVLCSRCRR